jgi:hypothetical protein
MDWSEDLVGLGVIQSSDLPDEASVFGVQMPGHFCPYGLTHDVLVSPGSGYPWHLERNNGGNSVGDQPSARDNRQRYREQV